MKKIGLFCIALLAALSLTGVGYAWFADTLVINGAMKTGVFDAVVYAAMSNDLAGTRDPLSDGVWTLNAFDIPKWNGYRSATVRTGTTGVSSLWTKTEYIQFSQPYTGYAGSAGFTIKNTGTIPIRIEAVTITKSATGSDPTASRLTITTYGALDVSMPGRLDPGQCGVGAIFPRFSAGVDPGDVYTVTVTITSAPWNQ